MRVISKKRLREFWDVHPAAEGPLKVWWKISLDADWASIQDVRKVFPHADAVALECPGSQPLVVTVFNIGGGKFRLIARIIYEYRRVYVKMVLTHKDYSRERWKSAICRA